MREHSKHILFAALMVFVFGVTGSPLRATNSEWDDLAILKPGQLIRVELKDTKTHDGEFQSLSNQGITLRQARGEQTFARMDVQEVYSWRKNHRLRNTIIGVAVGVAVAAPIVLINARNRWWHSSAWVWPVFLGISAGIGATIPSITWQEVYRAPQH